MSSAGPLTQDEPVSAGQELWDRPVKITCPIDKEEVARAVDRARQHLLSLQNQELGYWVGELQSDSSLTAEYIMLMHFLGRGGTPKEKKLARYLRECQLPDGGWNIYYGGPSEVSASVKAYFALKLAGTSPDKPFMARARERILALGGVTSVNVFTSISLALFGQYPWDKIPSLPPELILLPGNLFFNSVSYWSRTVITPLLIVMDQKPIKVIPEASGIRELYRNAEVSTVSFSGDGRFLSLKSLFLLSDFAVKVAERIVLDRPGLNPFRELALKKAERWMVDRMGEGGLGAIYPAMVNSVVALSCLGVPQDHPLVASALKEMELLEWEDGDVIRLQPCHSPVWDTALAINALIESGIPGNHSSLQKACSWLLGKQVARSGDWAAKRKGVEPGGWYFQFHNEFYPDNDDTAMVLMALKKVRFPPELSSRVKEETERGLRWLLEMQCSDGGWGSFDIDNDRMFLNNIPFADHGALLDPSTPDLAGRALEAMGCYGFDLSFPPARRAVAYLKRTQERCGAWYGRWGVNYIYGSWSVLRGLRAIGEQMNAPYVNRAVAWLKSRQNPDGGWGEDCRSYTDPRSAGIGASTPSQTGWALLGLLAAGACSDEAVTRGVRFLLERQMAGRWDEKEFTGTGFPRVFYLRYRMYPLYFPLWALGVYRRMRWGEEY